MKYWLTIFAFILTLSNINAQTASEDWSNEFEIVEIKSPIDGVLQKAYLYKTKSKLPQPLIVSLHTWSYDYSQFDSINVQSAEKDYNYIHPDFRGANNSKNACCSELAITDIDASIEFAINNKNKVYIFKIYRFFYIF